MASRIGFKHLTVMFILGWNIAAAVGSDKDSNNPYRSARVGDWVKYKVIVTRQSLEVNTRTNAEVAIRVSAIDAEKVTLERKTKYEDGRTTVRDEQFQLKEDFGPIRIMGYYPEDVREYRFDLERTQQETHRVAGKDLKTKHLTYSKAKVPIATSEATEELWVSPDVPLSGKVRRITEDINGVRNLRYTEDLLDFGFAADVKPESPKISPNASTAPPATQPNEDGKLNQHKSKVETTVNSIGMKLILMPKGRFTMGVTPIERFKEQFNSLSTAAQRLAYLCDAPPLHEVEIKLSFYMGMYEVTIGDYRKFVNETGYRTTAEKDGLGGTGRLPNGEFGSDVAFRWSQYGFQVSDDHPVGNVTRQDAIEFCKWMSKKEGKKYRLPTEAEWEYANSEQSQSSSSGNQTRPTTKTGNLADESLKQNLAEAPPYTIKETDGYPFAAPVGKFQANPRGFYDMAGNVSEWCSGEFDFFANATELKPPSARFPLLYPIRGGNWFSDPATSASGCRSGAPPEHRIALTGFRIVIETE
jgi:formylglycine-generating enzyme required for sulfatase activity